MQRDGAGIAHEHHTAKPLSDRRKREERHDERAHQRHEHRVFGEAEHNAERERREAQRAANVVNAL